jgi:hypothetical protein
MSRIPRDIYGFAGSNHHPGTTADGYYREVRRMV